MRSFSKIYLLLVILIVPSILTCTKNPVGTGNEFNWYPLSVGNTWEYSRFYVAVNIQSDTACPLPLADTLFSTGKVEVTKLDTLLDSIPVFELRDIVVDSFGSYGGLTYYNNLEDGLYFYCYTGTSYLPPLQSTTKKSLYFKGRYFGSVREIIDWLEKVILLPTSSSGFLDCYFPPRKRIQYPLSIGSQWTYTQTGDPWRIDGRVVNMELVTVPAGRFYCYKIRWLYDFNADGKWESDIEHFEYIGSEGMVKRSILAKDIEFTDYCFGHYAAFDILEETQLTSYISSTRRLPVE